MKIKFYYMKIKIRIEFYYRVTVIRLNCWRRLACITVAGLLVKLAFRISPDLQKTMGYRA